MKAHPNKPHNSLFVNTFQTPATAASYLPHLLPKTLSSQLDWSRLKLTSPAHIGEDLSDLRSDLVIEVPFLKKYPGRTPVMIIFEHQSTTHKRMPFRTAAYMMRTLERWIKANKKEKTQLPLILSIVMYHGDRKWNQATTLKELFFHRVEPIDDIDALLPSMSVVLTHIPHKNPT
jgi:predicted transposase/invertase (TIGR01784 family)